MTSLESQELCEPGPACWLGKEGGGKLRSRRGALALPLTPPPPPRLLLLLLTVFTFTSGGDLAGLAVCVGG